MPYPRPVSPVSLETCAPSTSEIDTDDLLASDDELDDTARAAKRQRVENLAQSYLQGKPLLILSASLRGPFNEGWVNPWKKDRTRGTTSSSGPRANVPERVVQETDLRTRYRERLSVSNGCPEVPASSFESAGISVNAGNRSSPSKPSRRPSRKSTPRPVHNRPDESSRQSPAKLNEPRSSEVDEQSIIPPRTADWLKKDRKLMNFTKFEPPSSPTTSVASRLSDKARRPAPRLVHVQVPQTPGSPMKSCPVKTIASMTARNSNTDSNGHPSSQSRSSTSKALSAPITSPRKRSRHDHMPQEVSFRIVNSSSQLPRFEYRRCVSEHSGQQEHTSSLHDESILQEETILEPGSPLRGISTVNPAPAGPGPVEPPALDPVEHGPSAPEEIAVPEVPPVEEVTGHNTVSKETRVADEDGVAKEVVAEEAVAEEAVAEEAVAQKEVVEEAAAQENAEENADGNAPDEANTSTYQNTEYSGTNEQTTTEQNTCEQFPSAQQVPAPLGVSDRITSLHSTALPKGHSEQDSNTSPDTQLSTQAALLHAQKSFQDDLDSPEYYTHRTPDQDRAVRSPNGSTHSTKVTPFYRMDETLERGLDRSTKSANKNKMQAMSTQFMLDAATPFNFTTEEAGRSSKPINRHMTQAMNTQFMLDAATPYTFSTEKKQRPSRPGSGSPTTSSKRRKKHSFASPDLSIRSQSINGDNDDQTADSQSSEDEASPRPAAQQPDDPPTHPSVPETAASLPLTLGESMPTTGEDGQGVPQGMESFNLSEAIADAGSWLQQSFDLNYSGRTSVNHRPVNTADSRAPLMDLSQ
ncbi:uncharacterized protein N7515_010119 [Penicillium bovifimosum]|uniref:Protamine P1 n=1 Tax=Penicillium bovifimosum TaxID=126998 RepID=A0A9W9GI86_9EURO|nr:uncharacterized protein N7515_010119 [Penicillium bovifimosum]KAJ5120731.1 hypothetical protein N7515_010119 [Penicillium bovifimosum]